MQANGSDWMGAWRAFLTAHARITGRLGRELEEECSLPLSWYDVLVQLSEAPEQRLRMHDLAQAVLLSRAGLTRLVDRMAAAALVARVACEEDRRGTWVELTPAGSSKLAEAAPIHLRGIEQHFGQQLSAGERRTMERAFARLLANMEED